MTTAGVIDVTGVISGSYISTGQEIQGLTGDYYDISGASQSSIDPAMSSNAAWLGNQTPARVATLVGPLDFQNIADDGFLDTEGNAYYDPSPGSNDIQARWYGNITIPSSASSTIYLYDASTVPSIVYINGQQVVDSFAPADELNAFNVTPGATYTIDVEAYGTGGSSSEIDLQWDPTGSGISFADIPNSAFSTTQSTQYDLTMNGTGSLILPNTDTYTGYTDIEEGTVVVSGNGAFGPATAAGITVNGGTLGLRGGFNYNSAEPILITGTGTSGAGAVESISGNNTFSVANALSGSFSVGAAAGAVLTINLPITVPASGTLTAAGAGTVDLGGNITVGAGAIFLGETGTGTLNLTGTITLPDQTYLDLTGVKGSTINITNNVYLESQGSIDDSSLGNVSITGVISGTAVQGGPVDGYSNLVQGNSSLTAYYPLNDPIGSTTVADESSNDFAGTIEGTGVTFGASGAYPTLGTAGSFSDSGDIQINSASAWALTAAPGRQWPGCTPAAPASRFSVPRMAAGRTPPSTWVLRSGELYFGEYNDDSNSSVDMPLNQWNFVAFTFSGGTQSIYLNGALVDQSSGHGQLTTTGAVDIGNSCCLGYNNGDLQQAAIFDSAALRG